VFFIFVNGGSMTNAKVCRVFHDDKHVEEHVEETCWQVWSNLSLFRRI